jgi:transposase
MTHQNALFLGIDLSKQWLDAHLLPTGQIWHVSSEPAPLEAWVAALPAELKLVVMEATGGLETRVAALLARRGLAVAIVNPRQIRNFAKAMGLLAKSDTLDARVIALFAQRIQPEPRPLKDEQAQELDELMTRRCQLVEMLAGEKNRLAQARSRSVQKSINKLIAWLERQLKDRDQEIDGLIKASPLWREREDLITSAPGIAHGTARSVVSGLPELGTLKPRQISALVGVAPFVHQSGKWRGESFCSGGRAAVRSALYMAAFNAKRCNPVIREFFERLTAQGKPYKVAMVACMRKLLTILNAMVRHNTRWGEGICG